MTQDSTTAQGTDDWIRLEHAAGRGDIEQLRELLAAGADPLRAGTDGRTAYRIALAAGRLAAARELRAAEDAASPDGSPDRAWRPYTRGYPLAELRAFPNWPGDEGEDGDVVFMHDDLTVTKGFLPGVDVILSTVTVEWERFCRETLGFTVPDDFDLVPEPADA